jgi:hypothetical protein
LGGLCTALIADTLTNLSQMESPQTAPYYYAKTSGVVALQNAQIGVCVLILLLVLGWIISQRNESPLQPVILAVSGLGCGLVWAELLIAKASQPNQLFVLSDLPYHPVGSWGILGAQVFLSYMVVKLPDGRLNWWAGLLLKLGFILGVWMIQLSLWSALWRSIPA